MPNDQPKGRLRSSELVQYLLQILALAGLLYWCFIILEPFLTLIIWSGVLAIALYPMHSFLATKFKGRNKLAASLITLLMLALIILPAIWLLYFTIDEFRLLMNAYQAGDIVIPEPNENVRNWPLVGNQAYQIWLESSTSFEALIQKYPTEVKTVLLKSLNLIASSGRGLLVLIVSIILGGVWLVYARQAGDFAKKIFQKLAGDNGQTMTTVAEVTIRNIAKGVLGVSILQSLIAGISFAIAGIPLAGLWALVNLIFGIIQVGAVPVALGTSIYMWIVADTLSAIVFTIWITLVSLIDNVLKPIVFGQGAPAPMLVVFIGSTGGFMASGFVGLFTGAIILSLGYRMLEVWLQKV
ncbi:MAG TPA: AI-2E family transporter [Cyclobacteriaceae bacterium]|nr:AI-2E family transporter [Cyclobacteriaceae bacterium]